MIKLQDRIASGRCRDCWIHPLFEDRCIKTSNSGVHGHDHNESDFQFNLKSRQVGLRFDYIPGVYGWTETDHGIGLVVERIMDADGATSNTFLNAIEAKQIGYYEISRLVADIEKKVTQDGLFMKDLQLNNLVLRRGPRRELSAVIVDGYADFSKGLKSRVRKAVPFVRKLRVTKEFHVLRQSVELAFSRYGRVAA